MSVVVSSAGRSGTNIVLEILTGCDQFVATKHPEDTLLFNRYLFEYPDNYLTKTDTLYFEYKDMKQTLEVNPNMFVITTIRDPRDMILSKLYRGWEKKAEDTVPYVCIEDLYKMFHIYINSKREFGDRIILVKMEDVLSDVTSACLRLSAKLGIQYNPNMKYFYERMRNQDKKDRYKNIDKNEIAKWKNWETLYDGFFVKNNFPIEQMFKDVEPICRYFNYIS